MSFVTPIDISGHEGLLAQPHRSQLRAAAKRRPEGFRPRGSFGVFVAVGPDGKRVRAAAACPSCAFVAATRHERTARTLMAEHWRRTHLED
jgi:alkanesulfonate monooxygenase SsuD/methylene tetrahydromethanopterin reductase-like flavin-dependent oxidoreductase (luciferase family)